MLEPNAQSTDRQEQEPTHEAGKVSTDTQGADEVGGTREYMQQILEAYPEEVRERLNADLDKVHNRAAGTSGHQLDVLRKTVESQQQTNLALKQSLDAMNSRIEQVATTTTNQNADAEKAQFAHEMGMTVEEVDNLTKNMARMGFVRKDDIPNVEQATETAVELAGRTRIAKDLDIWEKEFGESFAPYREVFEAAAPRLGYDFTPLAPELARLAQRLKQASRQFQMSEQERQADRINAATTVPSGGGSVTPVEAVYDPQGNPDWHATFRNQPEE